MRSRCRRCANVVKDPRPLTCVVCGLGEPDTERPIAVRITVLSDILLILVMLALAAASFAAIPSIGLLAHASIDAALETLKTAWLPFVFALVSAIVLIVCTVGVAKGRQWGRRLQDTMAWLWFLAGANLALYTAIRPPPDVVADLALWGLAAVLGLSGFVWLVTVNRVRPRQWFRTMETQRHGY